jgi:hypothetical protein
MFDILRKPYPLVYSLGFSSRPASLSVKVLPGFIQPVRDYLKTYDIFHLGKESGFTFTHPYKEGQWGFDQSALCQFNENEKNVNFNFPFANRSLSLSQSLYVLLHVLERVGEDESNKVLGDEFPNGKQLIHISGLDVQKGQNNAGLWIAITPSAIELLDCYGKKWRKEYLKDLLIPPMIQAYSLMTERILTGTCLYSFIVNVARWPQISLDIIGDACNLVSDKVQYRTDFPREGYTLCPHNVDSTTQQFTFLAGIAQLNIFLKEISRGVY